MASQQTMNILSEGIELISNEYTTTTDLQEIGRLVGQSDEAYNTLVQKMSEGFDRISGENFIQYATNSRDETKQYFAFAENSASIMSNFAVLDTLMLRQIWQRLGARDAMTYRVLQQPAIQVPFLKQHLRDGEGNYTSVPDALKADSFKYKTVSIEIDLDSEPEVNVFTKASITEKNQTLHKFGKFTKFSVRTAASSGEDVTNPVVQTIHPTQEGFFHATINFKDNSESTDYSDTLIARVDRLTGNIVISSAKGLIKKATFEVKISTESNFFTQTIEHRIEKIDISVGDGDTINSGIPVQYVQDLKAMFKLDAVSEISDLMSKTFATVYDMETYNTFVENVELPEQTLTYDASIHNSDGTHISISRQMQNASLLDRIYRSIGVLDNRYNFGGDVEYYALVNPIDNTILSGAITPDYAGTPASGGVIKHYTNGETVASIGGSNIKVISSKNYKSGDIYLVPKSSVSSEICFGYFDYSQVLLPMGTYRNAQNQLIPNVMMNKRKVIHTFRGDAVQHIQVKNNTNE